MKSKDDEVIFKAEIRFKGSISDFEKLTRELSRIGIKDVMIDSVPLPDRPAEGISIGTWPTPEGGLFGKISETVPIPDKPGSDLMVGTWPLPEIGAKGIMIDTVPLPEDKFNGLLIGMWPILGKNGRFGRIPMPEKGLSSELEKDLTDGMNNIKINKDIYGGIRTPHIHKGDLIYFIDTKTFQEHVGRIALEIMKDLTKDIEGMEIATSPVV